MQYYFQHSWTLVTTDNYYEILLVKIITENYLLKASNSVSWGYYFPKVLLETTENCRLEISSSNIEATFCWNYYWKLLSSR